MQSQQIFRFAIHKKLEGVKAARLIFRRLCNARGIICAGQAGNIRGQFVHKRPAEQITNARFQRLAFDVPQRRIKARHRVEQK